MDKKDMMYMGAALILVLVIALVIKPMVTGQPLNTGLAAPTTMPTAIQTLANSGPGPGSMTTPVTPPTTPPTPVPTWNPKDTTTVAFVDPSYYGVSLNHSLNMGTRINETSLDMNTTIFATINASPGSSGTTSIMYIPFPYWEIEYTLEPSAPLKPEKITPVTTTTTRKGEFTSDKGGSVTGVYGSYSTAVPKFTVQVMDGNDPNRIVRTFSPPGGIDLNLWKGVKEDDTGDAKDNDPYNVWGAEVTPTSDDNVDEDAVDPRPWTEKFYEGQQNYYFIITAQSLDSYRMDIRVPNRYIGKY